MRNVKIVIISILILSLGCFGCQKKRNSSWDSNLLSICAVFQPQWKKTLKNRDKTVFFQGFCSFLNVFRRLFNFGWKTAQFDNKFESLEVSRFFWPPKCPLARINIEMEEILSENATVWPKVTNILVRKNLSTPKKRKKMNRLLF